ncbi:MAG: hypothetical protein PVS2B2_14290 [Candidatus Acidiferrum sp.]
MAALQKKDGWAAFHQENDLGRTFDRGELGNGLLHTVIEDAKVFTLQIFNHVSTDIGNNDAHVDAVDANADDRDWRLRLRNLGGNELRAENG